MSTWQVRLEIVAYAMLFVLVCLCLMELCLAGGTEILVWLCGGITIIYTGWAVEDRFRMWWTLRQLHHEVEEIKRGHDDYTPE